MANQNWMITDDGQVCAFGDDQVEEPVTPYRLYRFITELEDLLAAVPDDQQRLVAIAPLVRKLLVSSYWLQMEYKEPSPDTGWGIHFLYREHQFPLTLQMVTWLPGHRSTIHNHGSWAMVALIGGQERNRIWVRKPSPEHPDRIEEAGELLLAPGDIVALTPNAIHSIEPVGDEPTVSFNLYGVTDFKSRYEFDSAAHTAQLF